MSKEITTTPAQLLSIAVEKGENLDKLQLLMDMQIKWEAHEARKEYVKAMSLFRSECPAIERTKKAHNSKYSGLAESIEAIKPFLAKHGLSHSWKTKQDNGGITVECTVTHHSGHSESTSLTAPPDSSGSKNSIQAIGSTVSYLERYTLYAILGLASKDQDVDGNKPKQKPLLTQDNEKWSKAVEKAKEKGSTDIVTKYYDLSKEDLEELRKQANVS